ncbi:MAG: hypothetical protein AAB434_13425 [Planctomycetota bacterium]
MFVGQFVHTLDEKNRLVIPARFRPKLEGKERGVYLTVRSTADGKCLTIHSPDGWEAEAKRVADLAREREDAERYMWKFGWDADCVQLDGQWRLVVPQRLIEAAGLGREVMVAGALTTIQVWDLARWKEVDARLRSELPALSKSLYKPPEPRP